VTLPEPHVHLLVDPADSVTVQRAIQRLHAPEHGCLVVTPTAGTSSAGILLRDIVASLGIDPGMQWGAPITDGMRVATIQLLQKTRVRDLYVLRADHLHPMCWYVLWMIATRAQLRLWLVVHRERPVRAQLDVLVGCTIEWHLPPKRHSGRRGLREWPSRLSLPIPASGLAR
jgi:hypothetical protein